MATTVTDFLTKLGIRIGKTISATSDPTATQVYHVINEISEQLSTLCSENESELGRKTGTIALIDGTSSYDDFVDDIIIPANKGWLLKSNSRDEINLCVEEECINYSPASTDETQPDKFYLDKNSNIVFLQTPETTYTAKIPYWYHQTSISATSYTITGITAAATCTVTCSGGHGFNTGDRTYISGIIGMTELNGGWYTVTKTTATAFTLDGVVSTTYTPWSSEGICSTAIPFNGVFDNIYIEAASIRFQNIDEYKQDIENSWLNFLLTEARKIILMRKNLAKTVKK